MSRLLSRNPVLERAYFLVDEALAADEADNLQEALELYGQAVEICLQARELRGTKLRRCTCITIPNAESDILPHLMPFPTEIEILKTSI